MGKATSGYLALALAVLAVLLGGINTNAQPQIIIDEEPSAILDIGGSLPADTIVSRRGCSEFIRCLGNGTFVIWKRFSRRSELMSEGNRIIATEMMDTEVDGVFSFISHLIFDPVMELDAGSFTCNISNVLLTVQLAVAPEFAVINPSNYDLSDHITGKEIAILCPVESCVPNIRVQLLRGESQLFETIVVDPSAMVAQFNPTVTQSLVGTYKCRVSGSFMGDPFSFDEYFNITGTPQPPPTTPPSQPGGGDNRGSAAALIHSITLTLAFFILAALLSHV